jgi:colanic acid biosynthesis glycosyl transferase WcaI
MVIETDRRAADPPALALSAMRILMHDFAGHAFPAQLSRELARRGHMVLHLHFEELQTPKGNIVHGPQDPPTFAVEGIRLNQVFDKWKSLVHRHRQELSYGRAVVEHIMRFSPDVVLSANTPIDVQEKVIEACEALQAGMVIWVQDFYSLAVQYVLRKKLGLLGDIASRYFRSLEKRQLDRCQQIIYISDDFLELGDHWNVNPNKCHVVENWAPLAEIRASRRENPWADRHDLSDKFCILYSGTMGWKHNPTALLSIAEGLRDHDDIRIVVVAQGPGRDSLEQETAARALRNVRLFDFQPYTDLSDVLGTADILIGVLDEEAGKFSVPSKILSYLCAERPMILVGPRENLAARTIHKARAGFVVPPGDEARLIEVTLRLLHDERLRAQLGANGRRYAEHNFDIESIANRFEQILQEAIAGRTAHASHWDFSGATARLWESW